MHCATPTSRRPSSASGHSARSHALLELPAAGYPAPPAQPSIHRSSLSGKLGAGTALRLRSSSRSGVQARVFQAERTQQQVVEQHQSAHDVEIRGEVSAPATIASVVELWPWLAQQHGERVACQEPNNPEAVNLTYAQLHAMMQAAAAGLQYLGLSKGDRVGLIAESSSRWIVADQAAMLLGAATAVRGSSSPPTEVAYILQHAQCTGLMLHDAQALRAVAPHLGKPGMPRLKFIVLLWGHPDDTMRALLVQQQQLGGAPAPLLTWGELVELGGRQMAVGAWWAPPPPLPDQLATLVYTSGTTGHPKGVMLSHGNLAYQVNNLSHFVEIRPGDACLSLLPPWHIYQRSCTYYIHSRAGRITFTTIRKFRDDLSAYPPDHLICVPLVLDTLYSRVMARLAAATPARRLLVMAFIAVSTVYVHARRVARGVALQYALVPPSWPTLLAASLVAAVLAPLHQLATKLVYSKIREALAVRNTIISGGGSLASHLDDFFEVLGLPVVNGWGLTETSPVLACRRVLQNVRGTVGVPVPGTEVRVVDPTTLAALPAGQRGLLLARGPGVMSGYLGDEAASAKAFRAGQGWYDTGDLGWVVPEAEHTVGRMAGMLVLAGRAKDTIVLVSGKNIEPQPIEDAVCASPLVKHALLLGQDKRELGMLVFPDLDALEAALAEADSGAVSGPSQGGSPGQRQQHPHVHRATQAQLVALVTPQVDALNTARHDYTTEQHIAHVVVVTEGVLGPEDGTLTMTMKLRRQEVCAKYSKQVMHLLAQLRG